MTAYTAYAFVDYQAASVAVLQACQALAVAAGRVPHGQASFASCLLHDSLGVLGNKMSASNFMLLSLDHHVLVPFGQILRTKMGLFCSSASCTGSYEDTS